MTSYDKLKKEFKNEELLKLALTHKSWLNENKNVRSSNERLEFLGDAVLEFVVSEEIFHEFDQKEEGYLTALRANLVNTSNLAHIAKNLDVGANIFLSKGEEDGQGRENPSLLANTMEAIIGALFIDQGIEKTKEFVKKHLLSEIPQKISQPLKDAKSRLQEHVQAQGMATPKYKVSAEKGPDHAKEFKIKVFIAGKSVAEGIGKSKISAEQIAAKKALKIVKNT